LGALLLLCISVNIMAAQCFVIVELISSKFRLRIDRQPFRH
jgi:hypothetical protein